MLFPLNLRARILNQPRRALGVAVALAVFVTPQAEGAPVAFPGAEGEGRFVSGGRGGDVYHVTNLNDSGAGSFRYGLDTASGARTVVFDIGGTIALTNDVNIHNPNITIAGETAPGKGIVITQYGMGIQANNILIRNIRVRPGDALKGSSSEGGFNGDAISISSSNVMIDHVSTSWGIDENLSSNGNSFHNITVQYSTISQGLDQTGLYHGEWDPTYSPPGPNHHSMGSLIKPLSGNASITYSHNLWSDNGNRNPAVGTYDTNQTLKADIRNNVMYNNRSNGYSSGDSKEIDMNYVGNYIIAGHDTKTTSAYVAFDSDPANKMHIYQLDNKVDGNKNAVHDGFDFNWGVFTGTYTKETVPFSMAPVTTDSADMAYWKVLAGAGALPGNRDSIDQALVNEVQNHTGMIINSQSQIGGYPNLPTVSRAANWDTDQDGMPDWWEAFVGLNPSVPDQNGLNPDGYTNLEEYLHALIVPEPSSLFLAGSALTLLLWRLARRRSA